MSVKSRHIPVETLKEAVYLDYAVAITVSRSYASVADISADSMSVVDRVECETTIHNVMMVIDETPADMDAYNSQATMAMVDHTRSDVFLSEGALVQRLRVPAVVP